MTLAATDLVQDALELASLPGVVTTAMQMVDDPHASAADIGTTISGDPALATRLLKIVNSAYYGFPSRIDTVSRAITVVGTRELTDLILGSSAISTFEKMPNDLVDMQRFWSHSLYSGLVARILARRAGTPDCERCFVMGLLHDIGSLVMYHQQPERSRQALELSNGAAVPLTLAERQVFGFDHSEVGAELMRAWRLPGAFVEVTRHHHRATEAAQHRPETAAIHLADAVANNAGKTGSNPGLAAESGSRELAGLPQDSVGDITREADAQFEAACAAFLPRVA